MTLKDNPCKVVFYHCKGSKKTTHAVYWSYLITESTHSGIKHHVILISFVNMMLCIDFNVDSRAYICNCNIV